MDARSPHGLNDGVDALAGTLRAVTLTPILSSLASRYGRTI